MTEGFIHGTRSGGRWQKNDQWEPVSRPTWTGWITTEYECLWVKWVLSSKPWNTPSRSQSCWSIPQGTRSGFSPYLTEIRQVLTSLSCQLGDYCLHVIEIIIRTACKQMSNLTRVTNKVSQRKTTFLELRTPDRRTGSPRWDLNPRSRLLSSILHHHTIWHVWHLNTHRERDSRPLMKIKQPLIHQRSACFIHPDTHCVCMYLDVCVCVCVFGELILF